MKLQLGICHLTGRKALQEDSSGLLGAMADTPVQMSGEVAEGPILMTYRGDRITQEEESEVQPYRSGPYVLTWDGRLDNREELADRVGLRRLSEAPDPVIVLKAYEAFGEAVLSDLIGEFALTLWCGDDQSLLFARSSCGARPLYYVLDQKRLIWCSHFAHLVRVSGVDLTVNDEYVLQYLVTTPDVRQSPLVHVKPIPPNRVTRFRNGEITIGGELWNPLRVSPPPTRTDGEYEELCREKITEAVRVRLRSKYPVFSELSGGLDSSTVVVTADRILRSQNLSPVNLHTVSCVYEESRTADERKFIAAVEEHRGIKGHWIREDEQRITLGLQDDPEFTGLPHTLHAFPGRYERISSLMQQNGARVLLTGRGGDHLFWSPPDGSPVIADALYKLDWLQAHRECRTWSRVAAMPYFELLTNKALRIALGSLMPHRNFYEKPAVPDWVAENHRPTIRDLTADFEGYTHWRAAPGRRAQIFVVDRMFRVLGTGFDQEYPQIYASHPYSHRPLIEFCLGAPVSQFLRDGQSRSLMRRAMNDILPTKTARRVSKGLVDETIARALQRDWGCLSALSDWQVIRRGYVLIDGLTRTINRARLGLLNELGSLIRLFSLERWLRSLDRVVNRSETRIACLA